jgi:hypothetical protein
LKFIDIPVRPHIRQWIQREYGAEPVAKSTNLLGTVVINAYLSGRTTPRPLKYPGFDRLRIQCVEVLEPALCQQQIAWEVSYLLEEHFTLAVISFINGWILAGKPAFSAVMAFFDLYQIDEEQYSRDAFRKIWKDHVRRMKAAAA